MIQLSEQQIIEQLAQRLAGIHTLIPSHEVARVVHEKFERFNGSRIRDFIPLFVERHSAERLAKLATLVDA